MSNRSEVVREGPRLSRAEAVLGHPFRDRELLLRALTHRSYLNEHSTAVAIGHNERLEFLGDAVLGLIVADALVSSSPDAPEGELTQRRAAHVSEAALAAAAERIDVAALLRVGRGEVHGGVLLPSIRADAIEAMLGAVFLDGGLSAARDAALRVLGPPPDEVVSRGPSAKTVLQERLQRVFGRSPSYNAERIDGPDHAPRFVARVTLGGQTLGEGDGASKRTATEAAAQAALLVVDALDDRALMAHLGMAR